MTKKQRLTIKRLKKIFKTYKHLDPSDFLIVSHPNPDNVDREHTILEIKCKGLYWKDSYYFRTGLKKKYKD